jgi:hypothetical protein
MKHHIRTVERLFNTEYYFWFGLFTMPCVKSHRSQGIRQWYIVLYYKQCSLGQQRDEPLYFQKVGDPCCHAGEQCVCLGLSAWSKTVFCNRTVLCCIDCVNATGVQPHPVTESISLTRTSCFNQPPSTHSTDTLVSPRLSFLFS